MENYVYWLLYEQAPTERQLKNSMFGPGCPWTVSILKGQVNGIRVAFESELLEERLREAGAVFGTVQEVRSFTYADGYDGLEMRPISNDEAGRLESYLRESKKAGPLIPIIGIALALGGIVACTQGSPVLGIIFLLAGILVTVAGFKAIKRGRSEAATMAFNPLDWRAIEGFASNSWVETEESAIVDEDAGTSQVHYFEFGQGSTCVRSAFRQKRSVGEPVRLYYNPTTKQII